MQKKLIALAVAGLVSGGAFAQSTVTLYGVADATYDIVSAPGSTAGTPGTSFSSRGRTTMNSSFFGLKGVEDLGNGLSAVFQIESGVGENGGATSTVGSSAYTLASRDTYVGLKGSFGTLVAGTLTGAARALGAAMDINAGATGIGNNSALIGKLGGGSGAGYFDQRFANAIAYSSPSFSGVDFYLGYVPNENRSKDSATPAAGVVNTSGSTFAVKYTNGPIFAAYTWTGLKDKAAGAVTGSGFGGAAGLNTGLGLKFVESATNNRLGLKYSTPMFTAGLLWDQTKATVTGATLTQAKQSVWYIPVTYTMGAGKIIGQYGKAGDLTGTAVAAGTDYTARHLAVGYEYSLSKRTLLKAGYSRVTNKKDAGYDFLYAVSNAQSTATGAAINAGADPRGVSLGIRHTF